MGSVTHKSIPEYHILDLQIDDEWPERNDQQSSQEWRKHIASKSVPKTFPLRLEGFQEIVCGRQVVFFENARSNDEREHDADANTQIPVKIDQVSSSPFFGVR